MGLGVACVIFATTALCLTIRSLRIRNRDSGVARGYIFAGILLGAINLFTGVATFVMETGVLAPETGTPMGLAIRRTWI